MLHWWMGMLVHIRNVECALCVCVCVCVLCEDFFVLNLHVKANFKVLVYMIL